VQIIKLQVASGGAPRISTFLDMTACFFYIWNIFKAPELEIHIFLRTVQHLHGIENVENLEPSVSASQAQKMMLEKWIFQFFCIDFLPGLNLGGGLKPLFHFQ